MKLNINITTAFILFLSAGSCNADSLRESTLRDAIVGAGFTPAVDTHVAVDSALVAAGKLLFESKLISPSRSIACASCHVDKFGSADGLQNAIGVGGKGIGNVRFDNGGRIVPRNTLPFWGRGGNGFNTFFWDGKVDNSNAIVESQFGNSPPSSDPLIVAVHLPPVELSEMVGDGAEGEGYQTETIESANILYSAAVKRVFEDQKIKELMTKATSRNASDIKYIDIATAIASFIRHNFRIQDTKLHRFTFGDSKLSEQEIAGGLIFYGKGRCSACHNGPYFSDLSFHAIPTLGVGFGKNGFGVDYGRYNVTLDPRDRGKFRTPPLYNVTKTAPYSHSGAISSLKDMITLHRDPLSVWSGVKDNPAARMDFYRQLKLWSDEPIGESVLSENEISQIISFLGTLEYEAELPVKSE